MSDITARAAAKIAEFEEKKETVPLQAASELLAEVNLAKEPDPMKRLLLRREALETWLALVAAIDKNLDPSFNPQDVPSVKISPLFPAAPTRSRASNTNKPPSRTGRRPSATCCRPNCGVSTRW